MTLAPLAGSPEPVRGQTLSLPEPDTRGTVSVERTLQDRNSVREFATGALPLADLSQVLWAAQGITHRDRGRTAPSAGALYPLEVVAVVGDVGGVRPGVYRYRPRDHAMERMREGDLRGQVARAALRQSWMAQAPVILVLSGVYERTTGKYGERGIRYVHMEVGHAGQNIYLQAEARGLGTTMVGAFQDERVREVLGLEDRERPLGIMPLGRPR
jgi:SagB-type dehydrogenase family enzyme